MSDDDFDPDQYLNELASQRAGVPSKGVPPMLARPEETPSSAGLPDYAHDPVPPHRAPGARAAIGKVMAEPGFDAKTPDEQRSAIIDAVHSVTRSVGEGANAVVNGAASAIPFGRITGAALASAPVVGNGQGFRQNYDAIGNEQAQSAADHPFLDGLGKVGGGLATVAASGGLGAAGVAPALAPTVGQATLRAAAPVALNAAAGGAQAAAGAAAEGADSNEVFQRGLTGATAGAALGTAAPLVASGVGKLFQGAVNRSDERMLAQVGDGATKKMRDKLNEKADDLIDLIRSTPALKSTYKDPAAFTAAARQELSANGTTLDKIYNAADAGKPLDVSKAAAELQSLQQRFNGRLAGKEIAVALNPTIEKLVDRATTPGAPAVTSRELREEITRLQGVAFDRTASAQPTPAREAAAHAAGVLKDVLEKHVEENLPGQLSQVQKLNSDQTVLMRIKAAADYKANAAPNQNGTRLSKIVHGAVNVGAGAAGAGEIVHGLMTGEPGKVAAGVATAVAPKVIGAVGKAADEGLAAVGRSSGVKGAPISNLAQRLAATTNPAEAQTTLMDHVFGGSPAKPAAGPKKPRVFGLQGEPPGPAPRSFGLPDEAAP